MRKRRIIRKSNKTLNIFDDGGSLLQKSKDQTSTAFSKGNLVGSIGSIGASIGTIANAGISNSKLGDTSNIEEGIKGAKTYIPSATNNDSLMSEWGTYSPMKEVSWRDVRGQDKGQMAGNTIGAIGSGASSGAMVGGPIGAIVGGIAGLGSSIAGIFTGNRKAKKKAKGFNEDINFANEKNLSALGDRALNIDTQSDLNTLANYSAEGGSINIKKENRGKFTEYCGGKVTNECISKGKNSLSPAVRKRAVFAENARGWNHDYGGYLNKYDNGGNLNTNIPNVGQHGGNFTNGVTKIENGGTHEDNPMEGVLMGIDEQGVPNLVEEGEVKYNDYMFSNRLFADKKLLSDNKLPTKYNNNSFAKIAENLSKESSERPNDPISKNGLLDSMSKLQQSQEIIKMGKNKTTKTNVFDIGGLLNNSLSNTKMIGMNNTLSRLDIPNLAKSNNVNSIDTGDTIDTGTKGLASYLRYAPVLGSGINVITDLAGLTNKPDYTNSDIIGNATNTLKESTFNPIGNYLTYNPLDRDYYTNKLNAQSGATRRAIENQSGGNRASATAGILAADYNTQGRLGDLARQSEEYNQAQKERVEGFNRQTNMFNSEMGLRTDSLNKQNDELRFRAKAMQAQMREQTDLRSSLGKSANLTNLFDNLGDVGREEFSKNTVNSLNNEYYSIDNTGKINYKNKFNKLSKPRQDKIRKEANNRLK